MSRLVRVVTLALGIATLVTAAFTQEVTPAPASTLQSGTHTAPEATPIMIGRILDMPKLTPTPTADTAYDYINPCSLIPLAEIQAITGEHMLFGSTVAGEGLTNDLSKASVMPDIDGRAERSLCLLNTDVEYVKPQMAIGITPQVSRALFDSRYRQENNDDNHVMWAERVSTRGLPDADSAYMTYAVSRGKRLYQELFVHTTAGQTLEILRPNKDQLRQLAYEALRTLDGSRHPGK